MRIPFAVITAAFSFASTVAAAVDQPLDSTHWEVRIEGSIVPGITEGLDGVRNKYGFGGDIVLLYHAPITSTPLCLLVGVGIFDDSRRGRVNVPDNVAEYDAQGILVTTGVVYLLDPRLWLEARIDVRGGEGIITAKQTFSNGDFTVEGNHGQYASAAATIGIYYAFPSSLTIGIDGGYDRFRGKSDFVNNEITVKGDGVTIGVAAGCRF